MTEYTFEIYNIETQETIYITNVKYSDRISEYERLVDANKQKDIICLRNGLIQDDHSWLLYEANDM